MDFNETVNERIHEMLAEEPYRDEFAALGISHEDWEVYQRVIATLEVADELDAPDPKVRERYERINATTYTPEDIEKGKQWAKDAGL